MELKIGDKIVNVEMKDGVPTIRAVTEEVRYPDGRIDVIVHVPCFQVGTQVKEML